MTKEDRTEIKHLIEYELKKITQKVIELKDLTGSVTPDDAVGRISRMDAIHNNSIVQASITNLENRLDQLTLAFHLIDEPDFGLCIKCHKAIPMERLKLRPEIRLCADCMRR